MLHAFWLSLRTTFTEQDFPLYTDNKRPKSLEKLIYYNIGLVFQFKMVKCPHVVVHSLWASLGLLVVSVPKRELIEKIITRDGIQSMMTSSDGNVFRVTGPLWRVDSPHKGQWRGALMFSLIYPWISGWETITGELKRHLTHYDVIVMGKWHHKVLGITGLLDRKIVFWNYWGSYVSKHKLDKQA